MSADPGHYVPGSGEGSVQGDVLRFTAGQPAPPSTGITDALRFARAQRDGLQHALTEDLYDALQALEDRLAPVLRQAPPIELVDGGDAEQAWLVTSRVANEVIQLGRSAGDQAGEVRTVAARLRRLIELVDLS